MGGCGSGGHYVVRGRIEDKCFLDVYWLIKNKYILSGNYQSGSLHWTKKPSMEKSSIGYRYYDNDKKMVLNYSCDGESYECNIHLTKIKTNFGGFRWAFECPKCGGTYTKLYCKSAHFRCRKCHKLVHTSSQQGYMDRLIRKTHKIKDRLGGEDNYYRKPKYMRWKKYSALMEKLDSLDELFAYNMMSRFGFEM